MGRLVVAFTLLLLAGASGCRLGGPGSLAPTGTDVGSVALVDQAGQRLTLAELRGKVVLVDVWATWCPPCRRSLPEVAQLQRGGSADLAVVAISLDDKGFEAVAPFLASHPELGLKAHVPASKKALAPFGEIQGIPTSFVLDRQGRVLTSWVGYQEGRAGDAVKEALQQGS